MDSFQKLRFVYNHPTAFGVVLLWQEKTSQVSLFHSKTILMTQNFTSDVNVTLGLLRYLKLRFLTPNFPFSNNVLPCTNHHSRENRPSAGSNNANRGQSTEKEVSVNQVMLLFKPLRLSIFSEDASYSDETSLPCNSLIVELLFDILLELEPSILKLHALI
ncbi:hypothetical protein PVK06_041370 [Gossypium arboreum]|uniref:Uncharacterized protein n=1 Tax=Gossypium arboreum TaxID=29729 RepID=A0ABR0N814_GOSAR|nr:hypothetical protein PVK06_041370 [Gossypium arboreum]